ncbi:MAG: hypothetical protein LDL50_01235 [Chloroflexi bacterium]|nr:hypothetical protein [Chloroflexota bacterium]
MRYVVKASRSYLEGKPDATVAYLPLASLFAERWQEFTADSFKDLARLETLNAELMTLPQMEDVIRSAAPVYIPGGNIFLLNHRLHVSRLTLFLRTEHPDLQRPEHGRRSALRGAERYALQFLVSGSRQPCAS